MSDFKKQWEASREIEREFGLQSTAAVNSTWLHLRDIENRSDYSFDCPIGLWRGRLDAKAWGKKANILLYFSELDTGAKISLSVYWTARYQPANGGPNFKVEGEPGEIFELHNDKNKNGYSKLLTARKLPVADQPDAIGQSS